ncbi:aminotransferase class I/II-fold pyridoxal phosphate-dependent enzyme [Microvirga sp. ACRRW]|uniref:aminotransferase class I/II-fold pyridoxal phosphate-dependent enzyme n=1 Tax=Microvirga sp. ACRRW TaxID=2918205 RepID=UPI001EF6AC0D|nr:aminotransferase class I/II-fold pyridoxal phosphate-dependent enzyme [Microvirga sp. ACRRW]MCG7393861.1 aminotransferase class I/II-fold pyridoxal phosphate-dependent enzyme [Microvirga sp. ACRRW]
MQIISNRVRVSSNSSAPIREFIFQSRYAERRHEPGICDFTLGNPHEMPLPGIVDAIQRHAVPHDKDWFAYKTSEPEPQAFLAECLTEELSLPFEPADIALTNGGFAAIAVALRLLLDVGDEAIFPVPAWFNYEAMLLAADSVPKKVNLQGARFDLDLSAIEEAITSRTRLVIINSPHNPTGRIYGRSELERLARMLDRASERIGHRILILSDEPYRRIRFDNHEFTSPAKIYPWTLIAYSYGKVLLAPGQRLGYLAVSPLMPREERQALQQNFFSAQKNLGWCFPNAVMQYALPDLEKLSIDMTALASKRRLMTETLGGAGYEVLRPEGTFYMFCKYPNGDAQQFLDALADHDVFVLPGRIVDAPDHFRISLTASADMVARSLPIFADVAGTMRKKHQPAA